MAEKGSTTRLNKVLFGPWGLRSGWRLIVFNALFLTLSLAVNAAAKRIYGTSEPVWTAHVFLVGRAWSLLIAILSVWIMAGVEHRSFAQYGLSRTGAFGRLFWQGAAWGILSVSAVVGLISLRGGYSIRGVALQGGDVLLFTALWAVAFAVAGVFEELVFRGYELFTLATGVRFWPAAVILSAVFGFYLHYVMKPNETWVDGLSVSLIGLFLCLTVRRTGNLWFAIGWHFAFNFAALFLFGFPNTGNKGLPLPNHLFDGIIQGPQWLTGGPMGAEASLFIFPVILVLFAAFHFRFKGKRFPRVRRGSDKSAGI